MKTKYRRNRRPTTGQLPLPFHRATLSRKVCFAEFDAAKHNISDLDLRTVPRRHIMQAVYDNMAKVS